MMKALCFSLPPTSLRHQYLPNKFFITDADEGRYALVISLNHLANGNL